MGLFDLQIDAMKRLGYEPRKASNTWSVMGLEHLSRQFQAWANELDPKQNLSKLKGNKHTIVHAITGVYMAINHLVSMLEVIERKGK